MDQKTLQLGPRALPLKPLEERTVPKSGGNAMAFALLLVAVLFPSAARAVKIETVPVGNPGNAGELSGGITLGGIPYEYRIGKF